MGNNIVTPPEYQTKQLNNIKNWAGLIEFIGLWLTVLSIFVLFFSKKLVDYSIIFPAIFQLVLGVVVIILGWKIRKAPVVAKKKIQIILSLSTLYIILTIISLWQGFSTGWYLPLGLFLASAFSLNGLKNLNNPASQVQEEVIENMTGKEKMKDLFKVLGLGIFIFLVVGIIGYIYYLVTK